MRPDTMLGKPRFTKDARRVYGRALDAMEEAGVPYLIGGAVALNHFTGIWRDTKDLDLFVRPGDVNDSLAALAGVGLRTERVYPSWLSKAWGDEYFVDLIHRNANGLHPVTDAWFERAPRTDLIDREVRLIPAEEMIFSKMFVGARNRYDGADILHVLYAAGDGLDWDVLLDLAGTSHAGLLLSHLNLYEWAYPAYADRVPDGVHRALRERVREDVRDPAHPFRGRLLDRKAFEADVEGWGLPDLLEANLDRVRGEDHARAERDEPGGGARP